MIVVGFLGRDGGGGALALEVARRSAAAGAKVEMVGVAAGDATGDALLLKLASAGIGHATVIRTAAGGLEPADLELALRYLPDVRAIVLVYPDAGLAATASAGSSFSSAPLVIVGPAEVPAGDALVLEPPPADPDGTFAGFVADLAVRLDAGDAPEAAFRTTVERLAVDRVEPA